MVTVVGYSRRRVRRCKCLYFFWKSDTEEERMTRSLAYTGWPDHQTKPDRWRTQDDQTRPDRWCTGWPDQTRSLAYRMTRPDQTRSLAYRMTRPLRPDQIIGVQDGTREYLTNIILVLRYSLVPSCTPMIWSGLSGLANSDHTIGRAKPCFPIISYGEKNSQRGGHNHPPLNMPLPAREYVERNWRNDATLSDSMLPNTHKQSKPN